MKKIMFNTKLGLERAVLEGRKTQTRRIITHPKTFHGKDVCGFYVCKRVSDGVVTDVCMYDKDEGFIDEGQILPNYRIGEVVAIAQSYLNIAEELENCSNASCAEHFENNLRDVSWYMGSFEHPGFRNKMFTSADRMIHQIRITNVRIERLQDISDDDCLAEGLQHLPDGGGLKPYAFYDKSIKVKSEKEGIHYGGYRDFNTPREAYAALIDKVSGKGTWEKNPYVFVYDFELVK